MNFCNDQVNHRRFGTGTIISQTNTHIEVDFAGEYGIKKFAYPMAFDGFLSFIDPTLQAQATELVREFRQAEEEEKTRRNLQYEQKRLEEQQTQLVKKRSNAKKRSSDI